MFLEQVSTLCNLYKSNKTTCPVLMTFTFTIPYKMIATNSRIPGVPKKMFISELYALLANEHFFLGHPVNVRKVQ